NALLTAQATALIPESLLAQRFKQNNRRTVREIQRAGIRVEHWNPQPTLAMLLEQRPRQAGSFTPENQVVFGCESRLGIESGSVGFHEPKPHARRQGLVKCSPIGPALPLHVLPVVHAGALELVIVELE